MSHTQKLTLNIMYKALFIDNDLCDQLSVADGLSWICCPSPELILTSV